MYLWSRIRHWNYTITSSHVASHCAWLGYSLQGIIPSKNRDYNSVACLTLIDGIGEWEEDALRAAAIADAAVAASAAAEEDRWPWVLFSRLRSSCCCSVALID